MLFDSRTVRFTGQMDLLSWPVSAAMAASLDSSASRRIVRWIGRGCAGWDRRAAGRPHLPEPGHHLLVQSPVLLVRLGIEGDEVKAVLPDDLVDPEGRTHRPVSPGIADHLIAGHPDSTHPHPDGLPEPRPLQGFCGRATAGVPVGPAGSSTVHGQATVRALRSRPSRQPASRRLLDDRR